MWETDAKKRGRAYAEKFGQPTLPQLADETGGAIVRYQVHFTSMAAFTGKDAHWYPCTWPWLAPRNAVAPPVCSAVGQSQTLKIRCSGTNSISLMQIELVVCVQVVSAKDRLKRATPVTAKEEVTNATLDLLLAARQRLRPVSARQESCDSAGASIS